MQGPLWGPSAQVWDLILKVVKAEHSPQMFGYIKRMKLGKGINLLHVLTLIRCVFGSVNTILCSFIISICLTVSSICSMFLP